MIAYEHVYVPTATTIPISPAQYPNTLPPLPSLTSASAIITRIGLDEATTTFAGRRPSPRERALPRATSTTIGGAGGTQRAGSAECLPILRGRAAIGKRQGCAGRLVEERGFAWNKSTVALRAGPERRSYRACAHSRARAHAASHSSAAAPQRRGVRGGGRRVGHAERPDPAAGGDLPSSFPVRTSEKHDANNARGSEIAFFFFRSKYISRMITVKMRCEERWREMLSLQGVRMARCLCGGRRDLIHDDAGSSHKSSTVASPLSPAAQAEMPALALAQIPAPIHTICSPGRFRESGLSRRGIASSGDDSTHAH